MMSLVLVVVCLSKKLANCLKFTLMVLQCRSSGSVLS